ACFTIIIIRMCYSYFLFFFSSRRRHTRFSRDWSSDVCSSDLGALSFANSIEKTESKGSDPKVIVDLIYKAIAAKNPKARYAGGHMAKIGLFMRKILSDRLFDKMIASQFS